MVLHQDSVSQYSRQPPTTFEFRFNFLDRCNTFKLALITGKGRKRSAALICDSDFE
jgi:hypothetical protein